MKYRLHIQHLLSTNFFNSKFAEGDEKEYENLVTFVKEIAESGTYLSIVDNNGDTLVIPKGIIQSSVITVEKA